MKNIFSVLILSLLFFSACSSNGVVITDVVLSDAITASNDPITSSSLFSRGAEKVYITVKPVGVSRATKVFSEWIYLDSNKIIDVSEVFVDGDSSVAFSLSAPSGGWPLGNYIINIYVDSMESSPRVVTSFIVM